MCGLLNERGAKRIRTAVNGFADRYLTTRTWHQKNVLSLSEISSALRSEPLFRVQRYEIFHYPPNFFHIFRNFYHLKHSIYQVLAITPELFHLRTKKEHPHPGGIWMLRTLVFMVVQFLDYFLPKKRS